MAKGYVQSRKSSQKKKKWIQGMDMQEGAFTKKAKKAGMGVQEYAAKVTKSDSKASTKTKRQANLAKTFKKMGKKKKVKG